MQSAAAHIPVLLEETVSLLDLKGGDTVVDCTVGGGSHAARILEKTAPDGRLVGIDRDAAALEAAAERLAPYHGRFSLVQGSFRKLDEILKRQGEGRVDGIVMDLGISSMQLGSAERGFSFLRNGPLDMRMDTREPLTAAAIVNQWPEQKLAGILKEFGEVRNARAMARAIVKAREQGPLADTQTLAHLASRVGGGRSKKIHPATQVFQALRMAVNDELGSLKEALPKAVGALKDGGRMCVISFHSLEDREVKRFFQQGARKCVCPPEWPQCRCGGKASLRLLTRKPLRPGAAELRVNPRSRSARLRAAQKIKELV